ncbi:DUF2285 domain-containing protein [Rhizobium johnstonii]
MILHDLRDGLAPAAAADDPLSTTTLSGSKERIAHESTGIGGERFRALRIGLADGEPPKAAVILLDDATPDRLEALARYWRGLRSATVPPDPRVTPQRRKRLQQMLRAVDARLEHATYRTIATVLFPTHQIDQRSWAGDALRETTIRLARDGMALVQGGYRDLLKRPRKS